MCLPLTMKRPPRQEQLRQAASFLVTSPLDSSVATSNSAASDPCPCLQTHNVITVALPHFHGEAGRIELAGPVRRCGQAPKSPISQTGESMEKKKQNKQNKICAATILHCTPQRKQKYVCPCPAHCSVLHAVPCLSLQGNHIHHCCLLWQHPTLDTGLSLSTLPHWRAVKQRLENATRSLSRPFTAQWSQTHCGRKSSRLSAEGFPQLASLPQRVTAVWKHAVQPVAALAVFKQSELGEAGSLKEKKVL